MSRPRKTVARGYGEPHRRLRKVWARKVEAGGVLCARCGKPIAPDEPFDLGHNDFDRSRWTGPEHQKCNRATVGRSNWARANGRRRRDGVTTTRFTDGSSLVDRVPTGRVRCGQCGWLIEARHAWAVGVFGPEHVEREDEPYEGAPPYLLRIWSRNW